VGGRPLIEQDELVGLVARVGCFVATDIRRQRHMTDGLHYRQRIGVNKFQFVEIVRFLDDHDVSRNSVIMRAR